MTLGSFILFCRGDRIRAAYLAARTDSPASFGYEGRVYRRAGHFELQHHLIDAKNELTGFVLEDAGDLGPVVSEARFSKASNCQWDGYSLTVLLSQGASALDNDGASVIGQRIYSDAASDIILLLENMREDQGSQRWRNLYAQLAFPLEIQNVPVPEMAEQCP